MTKFITIIALTALSTSAFGFTPKSQSEISLSSNSIYMKDKFDQMWETKTDCTFQTNDVRRVKIRKANRQRLLRLNNELVVTIDGKTHTCRIIKFSTV